jgi:hypothetical protein
MLKTHHQKKKKKKKTHPINRHNNGYQMERKKSCIYDWDDGTNHYILAEWQRILEFNDTILWHPSNQLK